MSRFGRQPAADILRSRGISRVRVSKELDIKYSKLNNTLAGHQTPSNELRDGLAKMLDVSVDKLFTAEPLAREQGKRYRSGTEVSAGDDTRIIRRKPGSDSESESGNEQDQTEGNESEDDEEEHDRLAS